MSSKNSNSSLAITPLGAGDLIDRAVRFYRKNFLTFVWIAAPPIVVGTFVSVAWTLAGREIFSVGAATDPGEMIFYYLFTGLGNLIIWLTETVATIIVMGGASLNFVRHLLFDEAITFRGTYKNARERLGGLTAAAIFISILLGVAGIFIFYLGLIVGFIAVALVASAFASVPFLAFTVSFALSTAIVFATGWLFFLAASRFAYVPQVMLVEGQSVTSAIGRSASLASGNVKRFAALFVFTTAATYSALALLYIPLGWYAFLNGVDVFSFDADQIPAWYQIASQFVWQASFILLMPVWMIGLCLLYVDERVRHEGYDIELMAARRLGEIPAVAQTYANPLQPALATEFIKNQNGNSAQKQKSSMSPLGLS
jgi:hypothetical protein